MENPTFLQDLAIVMAISAVTTIFCHRFHLPVVLGYILAGFVIGPFTPPYSLVTDLHSIHTLSELGVIFLLFSIGLEFSFTRLAKVGFVAFFAATLEILLMIWIGFSLGRIFGWKFMDCLFLGAILSISSTTIIAKVLVEMKKLEEKFAQVILGILIIEDLLAIVIIAVLSGIASSGDVAFSEVSQTALRVLSFIMGILLTGFFLIPKLLRYVERFHVSEVMIITVLGLCLTGSLLAAKFGFSVALGAFIIGAIIAETKQVHPIVNQMEPIRDMFTAVFFVSVGMLIDPKILLELWFPILMITLVTIMGKVFSCSLATFFAGYRPEIALQVGLGLAQIGEFSFIIARLGEANRVTSHFLYPIAVSVSALTTLSTPFLMKNTPSIVSFIQSVSPKPFTTFSSYYISWLERIGNVSYQSEKRKIIFEGLKIYLPRFAFYLLGGIVIFFLAMNVTDRFPDLPDWAFWIIVGITIAPVLFGLAFNLDRILWNVLFLNLVQIKKSLIQDPESEAMLHNAMRFLTVLLMGIVILAVGSFFTSAIPLAAAVAGLIFLSGFFLWGSTRKVHERLEKMVLSIFNPKEEKVTWNVQEELVRLICEQYPGKVETEDFLLPYQTCGINQSIRDLKVRTLTGASIVGIYRGGEAIMNPSPEMKLEPGDAVLILGDRIQIEKALKYLNQKIKEPLAAVLEGERAISTRSFTVLDSSPWVGKTIREINLREKTGVNILAITKRGKTITNPDGSMIIEANDSLVLFGKSDQLEFALVYLSVNS